MAITVLTREPGKPPRKQKHATEAEAISHSLAQPEAAEVVWEGRPDKADPPRTPRAMWTGTIAFGMVTAPVKLHSAAGDETPKLRQLCREHNVPIRQRRWCDAGDHEVASADIAKGIETQGSFAQLTDAELDQLPKGPAKTIAVECFLPAGKVPAIYQERSYFVAPERLGTRPYALLVAALKRTKTEAIARVTIRESVHLCLIRPEGDRLTLFTLYWPAEVRSAERLTEGAAVDPAELKIAVQLVAGLKRESFEPAAYHDAYADALNRTLDAKVAGGPGPEPAKVIDLMATLKASVDAAKRRPRKTIAK